MKKAPMPNVETPGPRRPDLTPEEVLALADRLLARRRAGLRRLSGAQRFRRWGA